MAERPCTLWRDSRNNRIYRVSFDHNSKVNMGTLENSAAVDTEQFALESAGAGFGTILQANASNFHAWLDTIPTVV